MKKEEELRKKKKKYSAFKNSGTDTKLGNF